MRCQSKAKVFMSGRSQAVRIPVEFRFDTNEVYIRQDPQTGDVILSRRQPASWKEIFAALDSSEVPRDFMSDRSNGRPSPREQL